MLAPSPATGYAAETDPFSGRRRPGKPLPAFEPNRKSANCVGMGVFGDRIAEDDPDFVRQPNCLNGSVATGPRFSHRKQATPFRPSRGPCVSSDDYSVILLTLDVLMYIMVLCQLSTAYDSTGSRVQSNWIGGNRLPIPAREGTWFDLRTSPISQGVLSWRSGADRRETRNGSQIARLGYAPAFGAD